MTKKDKKDDTLIVDEPIKIPNEQVVSESDQKAEEYKNLAQRIQAEFENFRKRNNDAVKTARKEGNNDIITAIFPVMDNFERAIALLEGSEKTGVELIYKQLLGVLTKYEVEEINAMGELFNPEMHHAIAQCEAEDCSTNTIVEVFQKGYRRKDKVLRPAMVKVAQ